MIFNIFDRIFGRLFIVRFGCSNETITIDITLLSQYDNGNAKSSFDYQSRPIDCPANNASLTRGKRAGQGCY